MPPVETQWNILLPGLKELQPEDLFRESTAWKNELQQRCETTFFNRYPDLMYPEEGKNALASEINRLCVDPHSWVLSRDTLTILPDPYSGFAKQDQPANDEIVAVAIPWRALKAFLVAKPPLELKLN